MSPGRYGGVKQFRDEVSLVPPASTTRREPATIHRVREKELRLALICYGGISLAVYMHGITKEVWRLARASRAFHAGEAADPGSESVYRRLIEAIALECGLDVRVLVDILAGRQRGRDQRHLPGRGDRQRPLARAAHRSLARDGRRRPADRSGDEPNVAARQGGRGSDRLGLVVAPRSARADGRGRASRGDTLEAVANFVRARWFAPPFSGPGFTRLLLGAFDAMATGPKGPPLLPSYHPLDLFVTVTDFYGYSEQLRLNSPSEVIEQEHRLILSFRRAGPGALADAAELTFAARATASFPGAFPPFQVAELDSVLKERGAAWPGRGDFLTRALPRQSALGTAETAVLIDGSVLANAPFRPAIKALQNRPAHARGRPPLRLYRSQAGRALGAPVGERP